VISRGSHNAGLGRLHTTEDILMATAEVPGDGNEANAQQPAQAEEGPRSLLNFLGRLSEGELEAEGSYQLHELCKQLQDIATMTHAKAKGKFKLAVNLTADVNGTVGVTYKLETIAPKRPTTPAVFWMTKGGNLSPTDTRQLQLKPREVPSPGRKARDLADQKAPKEV
jgi:hypothetical protein